MAFLDTLFKFTSPCCNRNFSNTCLYIVFHLLATCGCWILIYMGILAISGNIAFKYQTLGSDFNANPISHRQVLVTSGIIATVYGIGFGLILFKGVHEERVAYVRCWMIYYVVCWMGYFVSAVVYPSMCLITYFYSIGIFIAWNLLDHIRLEMSLRNLQSQSQLSTIKLKDSKPHEYIRLENV